MVLSIITVHPEGKIIYSFKHTRAVEIATKCDQEVRGDLCGNLLHLKNPLPEQQISKLLHRLQTKPAEFQQVQSASLAAGPNPTRRISAGLIRCTCSGSKHNPPNFSRSNPLHLQQVQTQTTEFQPPNSDAPLALGEGPKPTLQISDTC